MNSCYINVLERWRICNVEARTEFQPPKIFLRLLLITLRISSDFTCVFCACIFMEWTDVSRDGLIRCSKFMGVPADSQADPDTLASSLQEAWCALPVEQQQAILTKEQEF